MRSSTRGAAAGRVSAERQPRWAKRGSAIAAIAALVFSGLLFGPASPAAAGTLSLTITPIDISDNSTIVSIAKGQHSNRITYQVAYSCAVSACNDAQVQLTPSQPDPNGLLPVGRYLLSYESWVPPVAGGTISGYDTTGMVVSLGNLAGGASGNFRVTYMIPVDPNSDESYRRIPYGSFYPNGFQIQMGATMTQTSGPPLAQVNASPVTWNVALPNPATFPATQISTPVTTLPDTNVTVNLTLAPGNMYRSPGYIYGDAGIQAIGNYTAVYHLPAEASFVSTSPDGVYDLGSHTITWTAGTLADPVYAARGGWGINNIGGYNGGGNGADNPPGSVLGDDNHAYFYHRSVVLNYPVTNFPDADINGCNFQAAVTSSMEITVNYLDTARTQGTRTVNRTTQVACWEPFVGVDVQKYQNGGTWVNPVYYLNRPVLGGPDTIATWYVQISNQGNIPAVAVVDEPVLSHGDTRVYQIWPSGVGATIAWTRTNGTDTLSGSTFVASGGSNLTAPAGWWFTSAHATTEEIAPGRVIPTDTSSTTVYLYYRYRITDQTVLPHQVTNTANVSVSYPGYTGSLPGTTGSPVTLPIVRDVSRTVHFTQPSPLITATFDAPVVSSPPLSPGVPVTYTGRASTTQVSPGTEIRPQYVYVAPVGWNINSASVAGGLATIGPVQTFVIGGVSREVVVATWNATIEPPGTVQTWADFTVVATPSGSAPTGFNAATALLWAGDADHVLVDAVTTAYATVSNQFRTSPQMAVDTPDVDDDGVSNEEFAQATSPPLTVAGSTGLQVVKELCIELDAGEPDGCATWTADTSSPHLVPRNSTDITYKITVTNLGATALNGVIAYDVLPHVGDTSLTDGPTPRGSEFPLTIQSVTAPGVTMAYSASTNPHRPQVFGGGTDPDDWGTLVPGTSVAARMTIGTLPGLASREVIIVAGADGTGLADEQACNSVAIAGTGLLPVEPTPVCLTLAEADLEIELTSFENTQAGRPNTLAYTVTHHGGSAQAPASVEIQIPGGVTVTDLTVADWDCTATGGPAPVDGPTVLNCAPVDDLAQPRLLEQDVPEVLSFPIVVTALSGEVCTSAEISGPLFDPVAGNNTDGACDDVSPPPAGLVIEKQDGQTATQIGAEYTYTIRVTNTLLGEAVEDAVVTDVLPDSLVFVSASPAPTTEVGQTLTWDLAPLAPLGHIDIEVTVEVAPNAVSPIVNEASVLAPDPGFPDQELTDSDEDSNIVQTDLGIELTTFENAQSGRPSTLVYTATNHGGSTVAPASVEIEIPSGVTVTDLALTGWECIATGGAPAPVAGPTTLTCVPVDGGGDPRLLPQDTPEALSIPILITATGGEICTSAVIGGALFDPVPGNNADDGCDTVAAASTGLTIAKDDGQTATQIGAEYTYTITVTNTLIGETIDDAVVTDTLPGSLEFVSAAPAVTSQTGQELTWELDPLAPSAVVEIEVTVRVLPNAASPIVNEASVLAPDPGFPDEEFTDSDEDSNLVLQLSVDKTSDARSSGVREGDVVTYTVTVTGDAAGDYTGATITDDLSDVLDEATFVAGSAEIAIGVGAPVALADPVADLLSWTGTIPAGVDAVLTYQVTVNAPVNGELVNTVRTSPDATDCDTVTGLDEDGLACAVLATPFGLLFDKTVASFTQGDDGDWTIVYQVDVVNPAPTDSEYTLADDLAFGPGITISSAEVTPPGGVTAEPWTGSGSIVTDEPIAGSATHSYTITVIADAGTVAGTPAAVCAPGEALGFANTALLTLSDDLEVDAEVCASPVEPIVTKELVGTPTKDETTGRWTVTYLVTVTNEAEDPADLAYTLVDELDFPAGPVVHSITVTPSGGAAANPDFTGGLDELDESPVTADAALTDGVVRIDAASGGTPTVHEYLVEVEVSAPAGSVAAELVTCGEPGAGYGNWVGLFAGSSETELGRATACADIQLPALEFTKTVTFPEGNRPGDIVIYTITATNIGEADFTAGDPAALSDLQADVLDDADSRGDASSEIVGDPTADPGLLIEGGSALVWFGPLAAGATVEITYSVVLLPAHSGDGEVVNRVVDLARMLEVDPDDVPECAPTPAENEGAPACAVSFQVDTRQIGVTGPHLPAIGLLAASAATIIAGAIFVLLRRRRAGVEAASS